VKLKEQAFLKTCTKKNGLPKVK